MLKGAKELFHRHPQNPIIKPDDMPYPVNAVFNPGATVYEGRTALLMRVEDKRGISHLALATSPDGISNWEFSPQPIMTPDPLRPEEEYGIEDARITFLEEAGVWAIAYTAFSRYGPLVSLALTKDFKNFERLGPILPPENKDAALFPLKIPGKGNRFAIIHRPVPAFQRAGAHIWISYSPDFKHWGEHRVVLPAREGSWWDADKVGIGPPPLKTPEGWLILYHGVKRTVSGAIYRCGLALLDLENPEKVIARSNEWVFAPVADYELIGDVDKVVFPCGWVADGDLIRVYYGAADKTIGLATASISELLDWLKRDFRR
ncbi:MAG: glycosidase [Thermodesulforhabdaceae bacterium]|jgi:predicted GH43/DUF377 family glycosyl hydrolase